VNKYQLEANEQPARESNLNILKSAITTPHQQWIFLRPDYIYSINGSKSYTYQSSCTCCYCESDYRRSSKTTFIFVLQVKLLLDTTKYINAFSI